MGKREAVLRHWDFFRPTLFSLLNLNLPESRSGFVPVLFLPVPQTLQTSCNSFLCNLSRIKLISISAHQFTFSLIVPSLPLQMSLCSSSLSAAKVLSYKPFKTKPKERFQEALWLHIALSYWCAKVWTSALRPLGVRDCLSNLPLNCSHCTWLRLSPALCTVKLFSSFLTAASFLISFCFQFVPYYLSPSPPLGFESLLSSNNTWKIRAGFSSFP